MGIIFGERPRLTSVHNTTDLQNYGLSQIGNGKVNLEIYDDIQIPLQAIRRNIIATQPPSKIQFIMDYS